MIRDIKQLLVLRFLKDKGDRSPLISLFGVFGVLIGVFAIISVMSVMYGFEDELIKKLIGSQPHIYITDDSTPASLKNWDGIINDIYSNEYLKKSTTSVSPFVESEAIMYFNNVTVGAVIFGVSEESFSRMKVTGPKHREVIFGEQLGFTNHVIRNDEVDVLSAWDVATASSLTPKLRRFKIVDFVRTGAYARDLKYVYVNIEDGMRYFTPVKGTPTGVALFCLDPSNVERVKTQIQKILSKGGSLKIETWRDRNKRLLYSLKLERVAMFVTLLFIVLVASFSIIVSLVLMVESKKKDFTILLSIGLGKTNLRGVVLYIAIIKGTIGAVSGGILATLFCLLLDKYKFITLPDIYYDTYLPVHINLWFNAGIVIAAILICILGAIFPLKMMDKFSLINELRKN